MQIESQKYLYDIQQAVHLLTQFCIGKAWPDYQQDALLRSGVERQFEIIGEALNQLLKIDPPVVSRISDYRRIIAFRHILIHGYATVDDRIVWGVIERDLPRLRLEVAALMDEAASSDGG